MEKAVRLNDGPLFLGPVPQQSGDTCRSSGYIAASCTWTTAPNPKPDPIFRLVLVSHPVSNIVHKHKTKIFFIYSVPPVTIESAY